MNKQKFIELVDNPSSICEKDAGILTELASNYPYSPLVHTMLAKALRSSEKAKSQLSTAAIYISDRSVLKAVMEDRFTHSADSNTDTFSKEDSTPTNSSGDVDENQPHPPPADSVPLNETEAKSDVFLELEENLRKLRKQRQRFENDYEVTEVTEEQQRGQNREVDGTILPSETPPPNRLGTLPEPLQDLLDNKEEKEISDPKMVEQITLIDNFIRNSSSINRKYRSAESDNGELNDLTSAYSFTPPDLVTENLAQIMVRQGKTEKAIDIYEKLILKYPQKKAYFASCIEKLKNP